MLPVPLIDTCTHKQAEACCVPMPLCAAGPSLHSPSIESHVTGAQVVELVQAVPLQRSAILPP